MTPSRLKHLIYSKTKIDVERIDIREQGTKTIVGIAGLTEPEQRALNGDLRQGGMDADTFEVVEDEAQGK